VELSLCNVKGIKGHREVGSVSNLPSIPFVAEDFSRGRIKKWSLLSEPVKIMSGLEFETISFDEISLKILRSRCFIPSKISWLTTFKMFDLLTQDFQQLHLPQIIYQSKLKMATQFWQEYTGQRWVLQWAPIIYLVFETSTLER
jgi:hypothetical protein